MHRPGSRIGCLESKWSLYVHYTKLWSLRWVRLGWRKCFTRWWALRTEKLRPILGCFLLVPDIKLPLYSPASSLPAFPMIYIYWAISIPHMPPIYMTYRHKLNREIPCPNILTDTINQKNLTYFHKISQNITHGT